jgi:hypothetical protein
MAHSTQKSKSKEFRCLPSGLMLKKTSENKPDYILCWFGFRSQSFWASIPSPLFALRLGSPRTRIPSTSDYTTNYNVEHYFAKYDSSRRIKLTWVLHVDFTLKPKLSCYVIALVFHILVLNCPCRSENLFLRHILSKPVLPCSRPCGQYLTAQSDQFPFTISLSSISIG